MINIRPIVFLLIAILVIGCEPSIEVFPDQYRGYDIPDYFQKHILDKEESVNNLLSSNKNVSCFIFLTDSHWEINSKHSPEIIRHIQNRTGIENVFFGGDAINGSTDKDVALTTASEFAEAFSRFEFFFPVFGNQ